MKNGIKDLKEFISEHRKIDIDFRFTDSKVLFCLVSQQPNCSSDENENSTNEEINF